MPNTPTIKVILAGPYNTPHVVVQIGNQKTAANTEPYANRSNGRRSWRTWHKLMSQLEWRGYQVQLIDETVK